MTRIALGHHSSRFENRIGNLSNRELLMVCLLRRDDRCIRREHEMDTGIRYQVGLELGNINVESTVETKRGSQRRNDLSNEPIQVCVCGPLDVEVAPANVLQSFVVKAESTISVLKESMRREHRVVGLYNSGRYLR